MKEKYTLLLEKVFCLITILPRNIAIVIYIQINHFQGQASRLLHAQKAKFEYFNNKSVAGSGSEPGWRYATAPSGISLSFRLRLFQAVYTCTVIS